MPFGWLTGVGGAVVAVPAGDAGHLAAQELVEADGGVLRDVAKALHGGHRFGRVHLEVLHGLAHGVDHAEAGGFGAAQRAAAAEGLAGDHAGGVLPDQLGILIHHPAHHLRGGAHVRGGHVLARADVAPHLLHPAAAQSFLLGHRVRVAGSTGTPPLPPPRGISATEHFQVIHIARARTVSSVSEGWKRMPPLVGPRASLCWTR